MSSCTRNITHFLVFACVRHCAPSKSAQFRTHCTPSSAAAVTICPARPIWYRVQTGAARSASGRVCRALHGLPCCLLCAVCLGALGCRESPAGYIAAAQPRPVSSAKNLQNKKGVLSLPTPSFLRKTPHPHLNLSKFSRKNKKTPTKGLCSVLYLPYKP